MNEFVVVAIVAIVWCVGIFVITLLMDREDSLDLWYPIMMWPLCLALAIIGAPFTVPFFLARKIKEWR